MKRYLLPAVAGVGVALGAVMLLQGRAVGQGYAGGGPAGLMGDGRGQVASVPGASAPAVSAVSNGAGGAFLITVTGNNGSFSYNIPQGKKLSITALTVTGQQVQAGVFRNPLMPNGQQSPNQIMVATAVADKEVLNSESQQFPTGIGFQGGEKITLKLNGDGTAFAYGVLK